MNILLIDPIKPYKSKIKPITKKVSLVNIMHYLLGNSLEITIYYDEVYLDFIPSIIYEVPLNFLENMKFIRSEDININIDFDYIYHPKS